MLANATEDFRGSLTLTFEFVQHASEKGSLATFRQAHICHLPFLLQPVVPPAQL